jgi:uncharacterized protein
MSIEARLADELKEAMRQKDAEKLACIRQVKSKVQEATNAPDFKGPADDAFYQKVIASYAKTLEKSLVEFAAAGERGKALHEKYSREIAFLKTYLPEQLSEEQTRAIVQEAIKKVGATSAKQTGQVLGAIMKEHKGKVDPGVVKRLVEQALPS